MGNIPYTYRLHWAWDQPDPPKLARFAGTRTGLWDGGRIFVMDLVGPGLTGEAGQGLRANVTTSAGAVRNVVLQPNPDIEGARLSFILDAPGDGVPNCARSCCAVMKWPRGLDLPMEVLSLSLP